MKVLVACEYSGTVRDAFAKKGWEAWSCDLLPTESPYDDVPMPKWGNRVHITGDAIELLNKDWDLIIAHPPCTYLCNSGVQWLGKEPGRVNKMFDAAHFFKAIMNADCDKIAIENPIPHGYAVKEIGRKYDQIVQPWMFGHMERKATCLWLKGLPKLVETNNVKEEMLKLPKNVQQRLHYLPPGPDRAKLRSKTFSGLAEAMADQWG